MHSGERLRQLIKAAGWSQAEYARRLGEEIHWVNDRVKGRVEMKVDELPRMATALRMTIGEFAHHLVADSPPPPQLPASGSRPMDSEGEQYAAALTRSRLPEGQRLQNLLEEALALVRASGDHAPAEHS